MREYRTFSKSANAPVNDLVADIRATVLDIVQKRQADIAELLPVMNQLRKVNRVPTSSTNVTAGTDLPGDFNYDANYLYLSVPDGAGNIRWRRIALGVF